MTTVEAPLKTETSTRVAQDLEAREDLPGDFLEPLKLLAGKEKLFVSKALGVPIERFTNLGENFSQAQLQQMSDSLRDLFYAKTEMTERYDLLIDRSLAPYIAEEPDKYGALGNTKFAVAAKRLVRGGIYCEVRQHLADNARVELHHAGNGRNMAVGGLSKNLRRQAGSADFIRFNHDVRDFIGGDMGRQLHLDRETSSKALRILLLGDRENADAVERGIALEIATKRLVDRLVGPKFGASAAVFGSLKQDQQAGDIILFPRTDKETFVDVKYSAPNRLRTKLSDEQIREPGFDIEHPGQAVLWLGSEEGVGNFYGLPNDFVRAAQEMIRQVAVAA